MVYSLWSMVYGLWSLAGEGLVEPVSRVYLRPWLSPHRESKSVSLGPDTADPAGQSCRRPAQYQMRTHHACACSCRVHQPRPGPSRPVQARPGPSRPVQACHKPRLGLRRARHACGRSGHLRHRLVSARLGVSAPAHYCGTPVSVPRRVLLQGTEGACRVRASVRVPPLLRDTGRLRPGQSRPTRACTHACMRACRNRVDSMVDCTV
jgi:hypothetical protein